MMIRCDLTHKFKKEVIEHENDELFQSRDQGLFPQHKKIHLRGSPNGVRRIRLVVVVHRSGSDLHALCRVQKRNRRTDALDMERSIGMVFNCMPLIVDRVLSDQAQQERKSP